MKKADNFDAGKWLVENKLTTQSKLKEEETQNGTTYLTIKEPLTKAMEAMGYEKPSLESDNWATAYSSLYYVKPLSDTELLEVEVRPAPEKGKVADKEFGGDFEEEGKTDYSVITFEMDIKKTEDKEEKKFFGLMKNKYQDQSYDYIVKPTYLDLSKNTTEGAVSKITSLVKQKEPKKEMYAQKYGSSFGESRLNEEESNEVLTQEDFNVLRTKGFVVNFAAPEHNLFLIERRYRAPRADFKYLLNLLNKKNIPFETQMWSSDGKGAKSKMIWIDTKYTNASREDNPLEI